MRALFVLIFSQLTGEPKDIKEKLIQQKREAGGKALICDLVVLDMCPETAYIIYVSSYLREQLIQQKTEAGGPYGPAPTASICVLVVSDMCPQTSKQASSEPATPCFPCVSSYYSATCSYY